MIEENENGLTVQLEIIPNFEFKQKLLMLGPQVKVLEPEWFVEEVKKDLRGALEWYG